MKKAGRGTASTRGGRQSGGGAVRGERSNPVGGEVSGGLVGNAGYNKQNDRGRGVLVVSRKKKKHDQTA